MIPPSSSPSHQSNIFVAAMSVTTTANPVTTTLHRSLAADYEIHLSGGEEGIDPSQNPREETTIQNPPNWVQNYRNIPPLRPVNHDLDAESRPNGMNRFETAFLVTMFTGVVMVAVSCAAKVWICTENVLTVDVDIGAHMAEHWRMDQQHFLEISDWWRVVNIGNGLSRRQECDGQLRNTHVLQRMRQNGVEEWIYTDISSSEERSKWLQSLQDGCEGSLISHLSF